jgi:hypothetical protein
MEVLTKEAIKRVVNTVESRIENEFDITVVDKEYQDRAFEPRYKNSAQWYVELEVEGEHSVDWHEVYDTINNYDFLYNGSGYCAIVDSTSNGADGVLRIRVSF